MGCDVLKHAFSFEASLSRGRKCSVFGKIYAYINPIQSLPKRWYRGNVKSDINLLIYNLSDFLFNAGIIDDVGDVGCDVLLVCEACIAL